MASKSNNIWIGLNRAVDAWSVETWRLQSANLQRVLKSPSDSLLASLKHSTRKVDQMVERAGFTFDKTGIYLAKGVGGVYKVNPEGSGIVVRSSPGPINRKPADWITPVMESQLPILTRTVSIEIAKVASQEIANTIEIAARGINGIKR